jgi:DNA-binding CsgD family transcriptional regulator
MDDMKYWEKAAVNAPKYPSEIAIVDTSIAGYQTLIDAAEQKGMEVIRISGDGGMKQVAQQLGIAPGTVRTHLGRIYEKLGVADKGALATRLSSGSI